MSRRRLVAGVLVAVVLTGSCGGQNPDETRRSPNGTIVESGRLGLIHLRPGDCIRDPIPESVEAMVGVPCARPHHAQVVSVIDADEEITDDAALVDEFCGRRVEEIGRALLGRDDLPVVDVALLFEDDGNRMACVLEFSEAISEDLVRTAA